MYVIPVSSRQQLRLHGWMSQFDNSLNTHAQNTVALTQKKSELVLWAKFRISMSSEIKKKKKRV